MRSHGATEQFFFLSLWTPHQYFYWKFIKILIKVSIYQDNSNTENPYPQVQKVNFSSPHGTILSVQTVSIHVLNTLPVLPYEGSFTKYPLPVALSGLRISLPQTSIIYCSQQYLTVGSSMLVMNKMYVSSLTCFVFRCDP